MTQAHKTNSLTLPARSSRRFALTPMVTRDPQEPHRVASVLELFFDLVFVIAVSPAGASAHHSIVHEHSIQPIIMYLLAFEFIWWAWTNFSWFASSFDTDDWLYRLLTFVQMLGVLVLAAGIEPMFTAFDCRLAALGYVIMRIALVTQWLRAWLTPHPQAQQAQSQHTQALQTQSQESALPTQHLAQQRAKHAAKLYAVGIFVLLPMIIMTLIVGILVTQTQTAD